MKLSILLTITLGFGLLACDKCDAPTGACAESAPTDEVCQAYFQRWFYQEGSNSCEQISYSGCEAYGFATKEECESCKCTD